MLTYEQLQTFCLDRNMSLNDAMAQIDIKTYAGLRRAFSSGSLGVKNVLPLCRFMGITPNEFFGVEETSGDTNYGNMQKNAKKQIMQIAGTEELKKTISILEGQLKTKDEQLKSKDEQLAAKDVQINKLLGIGI